MSGEIVGVTRSISACKRCRQKKIKCSHDFPKCKGCERAGVDCVSLDPATGREISRSYVVHLESKIVELEQIINRIKDINPSTSTTSADQKQNVLNSNTPASSHSHIKTDTPGQENFKQNSNLNTDHLNSNNNNNTTIDTINNTNHRTENVDNNDSIIDSMNSYESTSKTDDSLRPTSFAGNGVSFSKLMFAAVHFKDSDEKYRERRRSSTAGTVHVKPPIDPTTNLMSSFSRHVALLPPKQQALDFLSLFFAQSNSQLPIFHREEFLKKYFIPIYGDIPPNTSFASLYTPIDWGKQLPRVKEQDTWYYQYTRLLDAATGVNPELDPFDFAANVNVPKRFKTALYFMNIVFALAGSIWHLQFPGEISENFKNAALLHIEDAYSSLNRLEALQAMLCLTVYSLMRPCVPGVWYLLGSSLRLCVDLNLHMESSTSSFDPFTIDKRRRLFWCCYSLDRQICVYLGRPFGIPEESIKVSFPSLLDDQFINADSTIESLYLNVKRNKPSYKNIALTMFKIRKLQAEIQSILYENREIPRIFPNMDYWLSDISYRLGAWKTNVPNSTKLMNCEFTGEFFDLNYFHARMMLHGLSPNRCVLTTKDLIDICDAAKGTITAFFSLLDKGALNYTWAVTQNVFMAQTNFLYSVFNSEVVKNSISIKELQKISMYSNIILKSLIDKCNAAEQCLEVLTILNQAIVKLKYPEFSNSFNSQKMNRLPSEDEITSLQPGGHISGSMRRLIVSIPELINSEEIKQEIHEGEVGGDKKRLKIDNHNYKTPTGETFCTSTDASNSNAHENKRSDSESLAGSLWSMEEFDLDRFMDQVREIESPESTISMSRGSASSNVNDENEGFKPTQSENNTVPPPNTSSSTSSGGIAVDLNRFTQSQLSIYINQQDQSQHQQYPSPTSVSASSYYYQPNIPQYTQHYPYISNLPSVYSTNMSSSMSSFTYPNQTCPGKINQPDQNINKDNREGQRVYKLMAETGTESIWDQFFAQPSKLDDEL